MDNSTIAQNEALALKLFDAISDILVVPAAGKPLPIRRKWIVPCLDTKAQADLPTPGEIDKWKREWTACDLSDAGPL